MEGRVVENFQKNQKFFKIATKPKIVPKGFQTCFGHVLRYFFEKLFLPSFPWRVESSNIFKKIENFSKFQKSPKSFPKMSKRVLNMFRGNYFENFFRPVFLGGSSCRKFSKKSKIFKNPKMSKIVIKSVQTCFEHVLG